MTMAPAPFQTEVLQTDSTNWVMGPYHPGLPGLMQLKLVLDGELVVSARTETGFAHRGLEKVFESEGWTAGVLISDRLDPEGAIFGELAYCQAVEDLAGIEVSERALFVRTLAAELSRVVSHLGFVARLARTVGAETLFHYVQRDREKFVDLFELLTGARFSLNFLRMGGVVHDVTDGFLERVLEVCAVMRHRFKEYNDLFSYNQAFLGRARATANITPEAAKRVGLTGPNARASGIAMDTRRWAPHAAYSKLDFDVVMGEEREGDCHGRYMIRIREIVQSMDIIRQCSEIMPTGSALGLKADEKFKIPIGEGFSRVESSRGLLTCHVLSAGGERPSRVHFRVPSRAPLDLLPEIIPGCQLEDIPLVLASLDLNLAEIDR